MLGFSSASLLPARKLEVVTKGGTRGIDYLTGRKNPIQGAGNVKGWEDKRYRGHIPDKFK